MRRTILHGWSMDIKHRRVPTGDGDNIEVKDIWTLILTEDGTGDRIEVSFDTESRDNLTSSMHHGLTPVFGTPGVRPT